MKKTTSLFLVLFLFSISFSFIKAEKRQMEFLNRGLVAVKVSNGVFLSWRLSGTDDKNTAFNIYRNGTTLVNTAPLTSSTNYVDAAGTLLSTYSVKPVLNGVVDETESNANVIPWSQQFNSIQLNRPPKGITLPNKY